MPTALPPILNFTDPATTEGGEKAALTAMRQFLADLLNTTGVAADAFLRIGWGIGEVKTFAYDFAPVDDGVVKIVECDGQSYVRATFPGAFAALGTIWGAVDGTHFNVPNARERSWMGAGAATYAQTFAPGNVNTTTNVITVNSNEGLYTGSPVLFTTTGTAPAPLVNSTLYYWIKLSSTTGKLASTLALAQNYNGSNEIDLTTQGTGSHTVTYSLTTRVLGTYLGEEQHAMILAELLAHVHANAPTATGTFGNGSTGPGNGATNGNSGQPQNGLVTISVTANNASVGGNQAFNVQSPALIGKFMIKIL